MTLVAGIKQAVRLAGRIDQKYNLNKIFIQKYVPPGYRKQANKIVDIAGTLGGGYGIVRFIESFYAPDSPGNQSAPLPEKFRARYATRSQNKTRSRRTRCYPVKRTRRYNSY